MHSRLIFLYRPVIILEGTKSYDGLPNVIGSPMLRQRAYPSSDFQEKLQDYYAGCPYRKLTQVSEMSILRRVG